MTFTRKTFVAALSALTFGGAVLASAAPAEARHWRHHGGVVTAGVVGGLALGAIAVAAHPAYVAPVHYVRACSRVRQPVTDVYGNVVSYRAVKVCH